MGSTKEELEAVDREESEAMLGFAAALRAGTKAELLDLRSTKALARRPQ
jgi:hypothetical protein